MDDLVQNYVTENPRPSNSTSTRIILKTTAEHYVYVGSTSEGLHISHILRFQSPDLLLPWNKIELEEKKPKLPVLGHWVLIKIKYNEDDGIFIKMFAQVWEEMSDQNSDLNHDCNESV